MSNIFFWRKKREEEKAEQSQPDSASDAQSLVAAELPRRSSRAGIRSLFSRIKFDLESLEQLEEILIQADFGVTTAEAIVTEVKKIAKAQGAKSESDLKNILAAVIRDKLATGNRELNLSSGKLPYVILVVGVNGVGKTTTIGKLATWLTQGNLKVVLGAADTFRAAAVDQLSTWAKTAGVNLVGPSSEGQDPASVAFQAVEYGVKNQADVVIIDTAGRLQNKTDLMDELSKIRRVIEKQAEIAEVLLVLDATTGQNGLVQAKAFSEAIAVTGIALTKLDGSAKGGIVVAIQNELAIPIKLVGTGEGVEDFAFFDPEEFASGLVA
jgi:fused signal recognition particle receptor